MLLILQTSLYADFRALLIGIDYKNRTDNDPIPPLCGAVNDVNDMYRLMTEKLAIPANKIKRLTEEQATRGNILATFKNWLIKGSKEGDQLFFMYSGHGTLVPDLTESQRFDPVKQGANEDSKSLSEAFVPYDSQVYPLQKRVDGLILDNDFYPLLQQLTDRKMTLYIDSCHSGGITRDIQGKVRVRRVDLPWVKPENAKIQPLLGRRGLSRLTMKPTTWHPPYQFFAAAQYNQSAYEFSPLSCGSNGAMTYAFLKLLNNNHKASYSNQQVVDFIQQYLQDEIGLGKANQLPQYYGPEHSANQPFVFFQPAVRLSSHAKVPTKPKITLDLWLDKKGRKHFKQNERVAIYYRVSGLKTGQSAWLSLLNMSPDGTISLLYPQLADFYRGIGSRAFLNAKIEAGKTYRIPRQKLRKGETMVIDSQLVLSELGRETFYAIISDKPLKWEDFDLKKGQFKIQGKSAQELIRKSHALVQSKDFWAEKSLQVEVGI